MHPTMQSVEEFMRRLFDEKIELEKQRLARLAPVRQKFFAPECDYGTRPGMLEQFQSEKVQSIRVSGSEAEVITTQARRLVRVVTARVGGTRMHKRVELPDFCSRGRDVNGPVACGRPWRRATEVQHRLLNHESD